MAQARRLKGPFQEEDIPPENGPQGPSPEMPTPGDQPYPEFPDVTNVPDNGAGSDFPTGRGNETPRDRIGNVAPRKPMEPSPMASQGSSMQAPMPGVLPFKPLPGPMMGTTQGRLFGSMGGLKGGGLGLPLDPISDVASDPIDTLIQLLMKRG